MPRGSGRPALSEIVIARRKTVLLFWALAMLICAPVALNVGDRLVVAGEIPSGEATGVKSRMSEDFARTNENATQTLVTATGSGGRSGQHLRIGDSLAGPPVSASPRRSVANG